MAAVALYYKLDPMQEKRKLNPVSSLILSFDDLMMTPASLSIKVQ
jgi:hypothetical protein